jgi:hypothetical protein
MADEPKTKPAKTGKKKAKKATAASAKTDLKDNLVVSTAPLELAEAGAVATTYSADDAGEHVDRVVDDDDDDETMLSVGERNKFTLGELTVHYPARDVTIVVDGHTAARVMAVYAGVATRTRMQNLIHPDLSHMKNLWATVSLDGALAMTWNPGLPSRAQRTMTVDPPAPDPTD